jgi:hypothetical protein
MYLRMAKTRGEYGHKEADISKNGHNKTKVALNSSPWK